MDLQKRYETAKSIVLEAGEYLSSNVKKIEVSIKEDGSPVTQFDWNIEQMIKSKLTNEFTFDGFIGEESIHRASSNGYIWACDPIDGTSSFVNGENTATISLGLLENNKPILGIIYNPFTKELYAGAQGFMTVANDKKLPSIKKRSIKKSVINFHIHRDNLDDIMHLHQLNKDRKIGKLVSLGGSMAYNLALVSTGAHSAYVARSNKKAESWDIAAGIYLVESVGGVVNNDEDKKFLVAATSQTLYQQIQKLLKE